nr:DUF3253 domain-containing protein [Rhodobacter calidifons]
MRAAILELALRRGRGKSFCPSEVARALAGNWQRLMPEIRAVAAAMPEIRATRRGVEVDPLTAKGPIRRHLR